MPPRLRRHHAHRRHVLGESYRGAVFPRLLLLRLPCRLFPSSDVRIGLATNLDDAVGAAVPPFGTARDGLFAVNNQAKLAGGSGAHPAMRGNPLEASLLQRLADEISTAGIAIDEADREAVVIRLLTAHAVALAGLGNDTEGVDRINPKNALDQLERLALGVALGRHMALGQPVKPLPGLPLTLNPYRMGQETL